MKTLKEWADFYVGKRLWVYPYKDYYEQFRWLDWRNLKDPDYEEKYSKYEWGSANGINVVTGKKGILIISFSKDENVNYANNSLNNVLNILGLPEDYDWVIESETAFSIVLDICDMPMGKIQKKYREINLVYEDHFILPPGIEHYESLYKNGIPRIRPVQLSWKVLSEKIADIDKLSIVNKGYSKQQQNQAIKMKFLAGCLLVIVLAIITGIIAICNSLGFGEWFAMFVITTTAVFGLIYIMSH
jgi:hypothetical protein